MFLFVFRRKLHKNCEQTDSALCVTGVGGMDAGHEKCEKRQMEAVVVTGEGRRLYHCRCETQRRTELAQNEARTNG